MNSYNKPTTGLLAVIDALAELGRRAAEIQKPPAPSTTEQSKPKEQPENE